MNQFIKQAVIGRKERADLPAFGLKQVVVKIDSGAYTSSIDVLEVKRIDEVLHVQFIEHGPIILFDQYKTKRIKSSNGQVDERFIIEGEIVLGGVSYLTEFSLTDRSGMRYPILLGRKLLNHHFLIDTSKTNLLKHRSTNG